MHGLKVGVEDSGFRLQVVQFGVQGLGFRVDGLGWRRTCCWCARQRAGGQCGIARCQDVGLRISDVGDRG